MFSNKSKILIIVFLGVGLFTFGKPAFAVLGANASLGINAGNPDDPFIYRFSVSVSDFSYQAYRGQVNFHVDVGGSSSDMIFEMCLNNTSQWGTGECFTLLNARPVFAGSTFNGIFAEILLDDTNPWTTAMFQIRGHNASGFGEILVYGRKVSVNYLTGPTTVVNPGDSFTINWSTSEANSATLSAPSYCSPSSGSVAPNTSASTTCTAPASGTGDFTVTAYGPPAPPGSASRSISVTVDAPPICTDPKATNYGGELPCKYDEEVGGGDGGGVQLCNDIDYGGGCEVFDTSDPDLRDNSIVGNDATSSLIDLDGTIVALYQDINYSGACQKFIANAPDFRNEPIGNDSVSSIVIGAPCAGKGDGPPPSGGANISCSTDSVNFFENCNVAPDATYWITWHCSGTYTWDGWVNDLFGNRWNSDTAFGLSGTFIGTGIRSNTYKNYCQDNDLPFNDPLYTVSASSTITVRPLADPSNLSVNNNVCTKLTLNWKDNSDNEDGFIIKRSTTSGAEVEMARVGANITTYTDIPPALDTRYYYKIQAYKISASNSADSNEASALNQACFANLVDSTKTISKVNNVAYSATLPIRNRDTVTFQIILRNAGPGLATINFICDIPTSNFISLRNMASGGHGQTAGNLPKNTERCPGANNYELDVSGKLLASTKWTITFDSTFKSVGSGNLELCSNTANVNYTDGQGTFYQAMKFGPMFCNNGNFGPPNFQEIAP